MKAMLAFLPALALLGAPTSARTETNPFAEPSPAPGERSPRWGLDLNLGAGSAGGDFSKVLVFLRTSRYSLPAFRDIDQRNPQVRVYVAWNEAR